MELLHDISYRNYSLNNYRSKIDPFESFDLLCSIVIILDMWMIDPISLLKQYITNNNGGFINIYIKGIMLSDKPILSKLLSCCLFSASYWKYLNHEKREIQMMASIYYGGNIGK